MSFEWKRREWASTPRGEYKRPKRKSNKTPYSFIMYEFRLSRRTFGITVNAMLFYTCQKDVSGPLFSVHDARVIMRRKIWLQPVSTPAGSVPYGVYEEHYVPEEYVFQETRLACLVCTSCSTRVMSLFIHHLRTPVIQCFSKHNIRINQRSQLENNRVKIVQNLNQYYIQNDSITFFIFLQLYVNIRSQKIYRHKFSFICTNM